eukprot:6467529-Amphidinium_carterae.2
MGGDGQSPGDCRGHSNSAFSESWRGVTVIAGGWWDWCPAPPQRSGVASPPLSAAALRCKRELTILIGTRFGWEGEGQIVDDQVRKGTLTSLSSSICNSAQDVLTQKSECPS